MRMWRNTLRLVVCLIVALPLLGVRIPFQEVVGSSSQDTTEVDTTDLLTPSQIPVYMGYGNQRLDNAIPEIEAALTHYDRVLRSLAYWEDRAESVVSPETTFVQPATLRSPLRGVAPPDSFWIADLGLGRDEGAIKVSFRTTASGLTQGIASRDHRGYGNGGHLSLWLRNDSVVYRLQSDAESRVLRAGPVQVDSLHEVIAGWGPDGMILFLDEHLVGWYKSFTQGTTPTNRQTVTGGLCVRCDADAYNPDSPFQGEIVKLEVWESYRDVDRALPEDSPAGPWVWDNDTTVSQ